MIMPPLSYAARQVSDGRTARCDLEEGNIMMSNSHQNTYSVGSDCQRDSP